METLWILIIGVLLAMYILLDGFDFGTGIIYLFIAKTEKEKRTVINAIGPIWDGNEVWLVVAGGTLFFAFPTAYASSFSGFYLALIMVLWLLMLRGISMEFRHQIQNKLWKTFWDKTLMISSVIMAIVFGAVLGNILRGVPIGSDGYFFVPFWTNFRTGSNPGIIDWFTLTFGIYFLFILMVHGANYIALKTEGELQDRARKLSKKFMWVVLIFTLIIPFLTAIAQPAMLRNFTNNPIGYLIPVISLIALLYSLYSRSHNNDRFSFLLFSVFIVGLLLTVVFTIFPNILISTLNPSYSLTIHNAAAKANGLEIGFYWFIIGISLASIYTYLMYHKFWGKVKIDDKEDAGY